MSINNEEDIPLQNITGQKIEIHVSPDTSIIDDETEVDISHEYVQNLIGKIENDPTLQLQNFKSPAFKDALRSIPDRLTVKRRVKCTLVQRQASFRQSAYLNNYNEQQLSYWKYLKYNISIVLTKINLMVYELSTTFEIWYDSLKTIEGHFGSAIGTYFKFYRFLFALNLIPVFFSVSFILIPHLLYPTNKLSGLYINTKNNDSALGVAAENFKVFEQQNKFSIYDFLTGKGYLANSVLFYGFLTNESIEIGPFSYSMPKAHLYTTSISYIFMLIILCTYMTRSYLNCFVKTKGENNHEFCHKVFCGWDFSIATENTAEIHKEIFNNEIKELLEEQNFKVTKSEKFIDTLKTLVIRIIINSIICGIIYSIGLHAHHLLDYTNFLYQDVHVSNNSFYDNSTAPIFAYVFNSIWTEYERNNSLAFPLFVTSTLLITIRVFSWLVQYEQYNGPRKPLYISMVRMFIVELVILSVFIKFWIDLRPKTTLCWETYISQEVYQILVIDFLCCTLATFFYAVYCAVSKWVCKKIGQKLNRTFEYKPIEFSMVNNSFNLIHGQILFWIVFYFSPLVSLIAVIFMFVTFYVKKYSLMYVYSPLSKSWRAEQTYTVFLVLTFWSLLLVMSVHGYIMLNVQPSKDCGPFRGVNYTYQSIFNDDNVNNSGILWDLLRFFKKPGVVFGMLVFLCVNAYFVHAKSETEIKLAETLHSLIVLQGKDKQFLTEFLSQIMNKPLNANSINKNAEDTIKSTLSAETKPHVDEDFDELINHSRPITSASHQSSTKSNNDYLAVPASILVERLRGIPGSPRTPRFNSENRRSNSEYNQPLYTFNRQHKTGLFP